MNRFGNHFITLCSGMDATEELVAFDNDCWMPQSRTIIW